MGNASAPKPSTAAHVAATGARVACCTYRSHAAPLAALGARVEGVCRVVCIALVLSRMPMHIPTPVSWAAGRRRGPMAAGPLHIGNFRVEHGDGFTIPCIVLQNRRAGGAVPRMLRWVCQRHLEMLLFSRFDGGSTGAVWKALNLSGLDSTSLCCNKKTVSEGLLTEAEFAQILTAFKRALPVDVCDPSSLGRIRSCTLLPLSSAAVVCRQHGRSPSSLA